MNMRSLFFLAGIATTVMSHPAGLGCKDPISPGTSIMGMKLIENDYLGLQIALKKNNGNPTNSYKPGASYILSVWNYGQNQTYPCPSDPSQTCNIPGEYYTDESGTENLYTVPYIAVRVTKGNLTEPSPGFVNKCGKQVYQDTGTTAFGMNAVWTAFDDDFGDLNITVVYSRGPPATGSTPLAGPHAGIFSETLVISGPSTAPPTPAPRECKCYTAQCSQSIGDAFTLSWQLDEFAKTAAFQLDFANSNKGWLGLGLGSDMLGSYAVVGIPTSSQVSSEHLTGFNTSAILPYPALRVYAASSSANNGISTLKYTRNFSSPVDVIDPLAGPTSLIVAGGERTFGKHTNQAVASVDLCQRNAPPTPAPTKPVCGCCDNFCTSELKPVGEAKGESMILSWRVIEEQQRVTFQITSPRKGWVGLGLGSAMVGSYAVIAREDDNTIQPYLLNGKSISDVTPAPTSDFPVYDPQYSQIQDPKTGEFSTMATFTLPWSANGAGVTIDPTGSTSLIYADGPADNSWAKHTAYGGVTVNLELGTVSESNTAPLDVKMVKAHAVLMTLAWAFFLPLGALFSMFKESMVKGEGKWFKMHRAFQMFGVILNIVAFVLIIEAYKKAGIDNFQLDHAKIGLSVFIGAMFMPLFAVIRPYATPRTAWRIVWEFVHKKLGYGLLIVGLVNCVLGTKLSFMTSFAESINNDIKIMIEVFVALLTIVYFYEKMQEIGRTSDKSELTKAFVVDEVDDTSSDAKYMIQPDNEGDGQYAGNDDVSDDEPVVDRQSIDF